MIERIIEFSIRNRFLVLIVTAVLTIAGIYATLHTPVDAIPDLSENQVIVFADWMGRSPREIEDQITYPLSLDLQGLAGVRSPVIERVQFLDDHADFRRRHRFLFRRTSVSPRSWPGPIPSFHRA